MKILALGSTFDLPEVHLFGGLAKKGIQIDAVVSPKSNFIAQLEQFGIRCFPIEFRSRLDFPAIRALRRLIKAESYSILHCLTARAVSNTIFAAWRLPGHVIAYRGTSGRDSYFDPASWISFLNPRVERIICVSESVRNFMSRFVSEKKLITIYKGHDVHWYDTRADAALEQFGIPTGTFVVACVANTRPVKGVRYLIDAFRLLSEDGQKDIHLLLIGKLSKDDLARLADTRIQSSQVRVAGFRKDVPSVVARCHAFVLPSISREGLPKALLEALCLGVPTIVTNVGGMAEVVSHRHNGLVVEPKDSRALADAIRQLKEDPGLAKSLGQQGRKTMEERFTIQHTIEQTEALYKSLL